VKKGPEVTIHDPKARAVKSVVRMAMDEAMDKIERLDPHDRRNPVNELGDRAIRALANADTHIQEARGYLWIGNVQTAMREAPWAMAWVSIAEAERCGAQHQSILYEVDRARRWLLEEVRIVAKDVAPAANPAAWNEAEEHEETA